MALSELIELNQEVPDRLVQRVPETGEGRINGGFFVLNRNVMDYLDGDDSVWERQPLERLARAGELCAYEHDGFWQCMDTVRDKQLLEDLWASPRAPWRVW